MVVLQSGHVLLCDPVDEEGRYKGEEADEGTHCHHNAEARLCSFLQGVESLYMMSRSLNKQTQKGRVSSIAKWTFFSGACP